MEKQPVSSSRPDTPLDPDAISSTILFLLASSGDSMNKFLAPLAGVAITVLAPAATSAQPTATIPPPVRPPVITPASPQLPAIRPRVASPANAATPVDPAALALAHQILDIGIPPAKRSQMFASVMDSLNEQARKNMQNLALTKDKDFQALIDRSTQRMWDQVKPIMNAALPDIFESMAHAYARDFSTEDLNGILAFVKTPAGQHFFERAPNILKDPDVQAAQQRMLAQLAGKLPEIMRQNKQDIADYLGRKAKREKAAAPTPVS
jgi:hypothetical protein